MGNVLVNGEIVLYGTVGGFDFFEDSFSARDVVRALAQVGKKDVTVRINSGGGIVDEAIAIYNSLRQHEGKVTTVVDSVAASAASVIAMAGQDVIMRNGAYMMIHDPSLITFGNADTHEKSIEELNAIGDSMADCYARKTGKTRAEMRDMMKEEVWLTAEQTVGQKLATSAETTAALEAPAWDYGIYAKVPGQITALATERKWIGRMTATRKDPPMAKTPEEIEAERKADKATAEKEARDGAAQIVRQCTAAGVPVLADALLREGVSLADATARIEEAKGIKEVVAKMNKLCPTLAASPDVFIAAGRRLESVKAELLDRAAAVQDAQGTRTGFQPPAAGATLDETAVANAWQKSTDRINAKRGFAKAH